MTELATDPDRFPQGSERELLLSFLEYYRSVLLRKADDLTDDQGRDANIAPSILTITGLLRHMAEVERGWFRNWLAGEQLGPLFYDDADPDGDLHPGPGDTLAAARAALQTEIDIARRHVDATESLDVVAAGSSERRPGWHPNLRWILIHMIEEYARHCGHADLLRERIDGATGD